ncbi:MAG: hypothetical protein ACE361_12895 [Aureliella sp.]
MQTKVLLSQTKVLPSQTEVLSSQTDEAPALIQRLANLFRTRFNPAAVRAARMMGWSGVFCFGFAATLNAQSTENYKADAPPPIPTSTPTSTAPGSKSEELQFAPDRRSDRVGGYEQAVGQSGSIASEGPGLGRILDMTQRVKSIIGDRGMSAGKAATNSTGSDRMRLTDQESTPSNASESIVTQQTSGQAGSDLATRRVRSAKEIVERIELLKRLRSEYSRKRMAAIQNDDGESLIPGPKEALQGGGPALSGADIPGGQFVTAESGTTQAMPEIGAQTDVGQQGSNVNGDSTASPFGQDIEQIFPAPVDAMQLGESLFRTQNYAAALKSLESVEVDKLTDSEHVWLDLLIALTKRRLGILDEAEEELRNIANIKSRDNSVPTARFWLKQTEFTRKTRPLLDQLNDEYQMLVERAKEYAKSQ